MKTHQPIIIIASFILCLAFVSRANAHALWLEVNPSGQPQICFGEYHEGLREDSEKIAKFGKIDLQAITTKGAKSLDLQTAAKALVAVNAPTDATFFFRADRGGVRDLSKHGLGMARSLSYGRYIGSKWTTIKSELPLDMVPVQGSERTVKVEFQGKPLAKAKLEVVAPNGWSREVRTDDNGQAILPAPWPGLYVVTASTQDKTPGEYEDKKYENLSYRTTLSFVVP